MRHNEARIQQACVEWFNLQYLRYQGLLFSSLNGVHTSAAQARTAKAEGMVAGVADLQLCIPRQGYHGLFIEMKNGKEGRQSPAQRAWQEKVEAQGYRYAICRTFQDFHDTIEQYLNDNGNKTEEADQL